MIEAHCSQPHYRDHLLPIWKALPPEITGRWWASGMLADLGNSARIPGWRVGYPPHAPVPTIVGGWQDEHPIPRPTIYVEHGAGQTYPADAHGHGHEAYSGSPGHNRTVLFLSPSETVADRWRATYPGVPAVAVGCPKLDAWHERPKPDLEPVAAITFHAENRLCDETTSGLPYFAPHLPGAARQLRAHGWTLIGHAHPRIWNRARQVYVEAGIEAVPDLEEVFERARVLAGDNTSALPEFASLDRPVVFLNPPWYRKHVQHGGRFWEWPEGQVSVDYGEDLANGIIRAAKDPAAQRRARARMVRDVYVATDGKAAQRAAQAIIDHVHGATQPFEQTRRGQYG